MVVVCKCFGGGFFFGFEPVGGVSAAADQSDYANDSVVVTAGSDPSEFPAIEQWPWDWKPLLRRSGDVVFTPFWPPNWGDALSEPTHPNVDCLVVWKWLD
jgi:hypothetical protein